MANALGGLFSEIAGAIREKTGEVVTMKPAKFPEKIKAISTVKNQDKTITENGTYSADDGYTGLGTVTVEVAGAGGSDEQPMIKYILTDTTASGPAVSEHTVSFYLSKETKVLAAWSGGQQSTSYYPNVTKLENVPVSDLTVDTSNANYNIYSVPKRFTTSMSGTYKKTILARILVTVPGITVTSRGDGFYDGKLNYIDSYSQPIDGMEFMSIYAIMLFKKFVFAHGGTEIPKRVLSGQCYLESIELPNITSIGGSAFSGCYALKNVDLSNITSIGSSAFYGCSSLTSINLNPNLTKLEANAFTGCTSLTGELIIPKTITKLRRECFSGTKFDRVVFHGGITAFGDDGTGAFQGCTHPTEFDFSEFTSVPTLGYGPWLGVVGSGQVLKIPSALFDTWSTKQYWSDWASQMVAV